MHRTNATSIQENLLNLCKNRGGVKTYNTWARACSLSCPCFQVQSDINSTSGECKEAWASCPQCPSPSWGLWYHPRMGTTHISQTLHRKFLCSRSSIHNQFSIQRTYSENKSSILAARPKTLGLQLPLPQIIHRVNFSQQKQSRGPNRRHSDRSRPVASSAASE